MVCCCPLSRLAEFPLLAAMVGGDNGALGDPVTSDENFVYGGPENADGHAGQKGAWVADVTYERDLINLTGVNGLDGYDLIV